MSENRSWIGVDWGTSNLRAWVFDHNNRVLSTLTSDKGMGQLDPDLFEPVLLDLIADHLRPQGDISVLCCGMVGAKQGWQEAPYIAVPCPPADASNALSVSTRDASIHVSILPGLSQNAPADVMRGEETQIAGFLAQNPDFDGTICLPGTHSKWVQISAGEVVSFRTFLTGDLFAAISENTVLRHSNANGDNPNAFLKGVGMGLSEPELLLSRLFQLRAEGLLNGLSDVAATERLSGYLIGWELAGARHYWLGTRVSLIGASGLVDRYKQAFETQGIMAETATGDEMVIQGLIAARAAMKS